MSGKPVRDDPLEAALGEIVSQALTGWDEIQGDAPDLLYHYTDVAGLIGICSSRSLQATNLRFMNDAKELAHSWKLMRDVLDEARAEASTPAQLELIDELDRATATEWAGYPDFYSVSFSADGDLLSQWRGYGLSGGGYAIGFDSKGLVRPHSSQPQPERFLSRVIYDEAAQRRFLRGPAEAMLGLFASVDPGGPRLTEARAAVFAALGELVGFAFGFKDPAWAEEKEWRAVYVVPHGQFDELEFRPGESIAVPYVSLEVGTGHDGLLPIREIVLGPTIDEATAVKSLELLLASNGYSDVTIRVSSVPLRS